jgi:hypothetical protein
MLDAVTPVRNLAISLLREAWQFGPDDPFHPGRPIVPESRLPHGVAKLATVPREFTGVRNVTENIGLQLVGYFEIPEGVDLEALKVQRAQEAGSALLGANWAEANAYLPSVDSIDFVEEEDPRPYFIVILAFSVRSDVFQ